MIFVGPVPAPLWLVSYHPDLAVTTEILTVDISAAVLLERSQVDGKSSPFLYIVR
jgi:hypothetical protein